MIDDDTIKARIAAIRAHNTHLLDIQAEEIAWSIGDTPLIENDNVVAELGGEEYLVPVSVIFPDGE